MATEHAKVFSSISSIYLSGVFSRDANLATEFAQRFHFNNICKSVHELYQTTSADLVVIAVPELSTARVCEEAFEHPWKLLIEKPVGYNLTQAQMIADMARLKKCEAFVGLNRRHYSSTCSVLSEVSQLNEPRLVNVFDQENPQAAREAGQPHRVVENWMYANSIHLIDYFSIFCRGEVQKIVPFLPWNSTHPGFVHCGIHFSSGDVGIYQAVWNAPGPWAVSISTHAKQWEMRPLEKAFVQKYKSREKIPLETHPWDQQFKPGLRRQAEEAIQLLAGKPHRLPSLEDALVSMRLASNIYQTK